jgi:two-component system, OmpR family, sensor histidine kinase MtrB
MRLQRPGLRTRVTVIFAGGALLLSAAMATVSYGFTRGSLLTERERTATRTTYIDAAVAQAGLREPTADVVEVLRALDTGPYRRPIVYRDGVEYARNADVDSSFDVPVALRHMVESGQAGVQRVRTPTGTALIYGVPLSPTTQFYEVHSMSELEQTLGVVGLVLALVAGGTTIAGAAFGWYTSRRALRPLAAVAEAARGIASGDLSARLDPAAEPELARLTSSFNDMVDQLAQRMERDRRFAADVSHELRSPLQTLSAAASVLVNRRSHMDERTATAADLVAEEVLRFEQLVTDLIEIARGDLPPEWSTVDMVELARQVSRAHGLPLEIVRRPPGLDPCWRVDARRIEQALANLVDNAKRHGGGVVAVRLGSQDGVRFIEVDDEGPGVLPAEREAIFNPFVRGRTAHARSDGDGSGLGLALVAQHAATHGGRVVVLDRPGGGARFRLELSADAR